MPKITETDLFFNKGFEEGMKSERVKIIKIIDEYDFEGWLDNECCKLIRKEFLNSLGGDDENKSN
jgi:hypothetical protein